METEKLAVAVVDIPAGLSAVDVQSLVNGSIPDGYYFAGITSYGPGALAFFRLRAERPEKQSKVHEEKREVDEDAAVAILETHPRLTAEKLVALLRARGIKRGRQWVYTRRAERGY